jgi:hypothetical protein
MAAKECHMGSQERPEDFRMEHWRLMDGSGWLRVTHLPTGISRDAPSSGEPVKRIMNRLLAEVREEVQSRAKSDPKAT